MEFSFNLNHLIGSEITKFDNNLSPYRKNADGYDVTQLRNQLFAVIDKMGDASAKAQGLHGVITTGRKLELSDHILYIMKDSTANDGRGACVGLLKVGHKKLFVYDRHGGHHELEPLCVLDFYVHESRQRMGCGKMLFEYMLRDFNIKPQHCAIDKPSFKFSQFLQKHYNLKAIIPQVNNFVVFEGFFNGHPDSTNNKRNRFGSRPPLHPNSNYNDDVIVRNGSRISSGQYASRINSRPPSGNYRVNSRPPSGGYRGNSRPSSGHISSRSAKVHRVLEEEPQIPQLNMQVGPRANMDAESAQSNLDRSLRLALQSLPSHNTNRALGAGANMYSRHADTPPEAGTRQKLQFNVDPCSRIGGRAVSRTGAGSRSGSKNRNQNSSELELRPDSPPMLQRDGPPRGYMENINLHQDYQGRAGHLKINNNADKVSSLPSINQNQNNSYSNVTYGDRYSPWRAVTNWNVSNLTVHGLPNNHQTIGARHYSHTRLW